MGVDVAVGVERGEHVPVVSLGQPSNLGILAGQKLVDEVSDRRRRYPLAGMDATLDEHSGLALAEAQLHALDVATLVRVSADDDLHLVRVLFGERVQPGVDFLEGVVALPAETALPGDWVLVVDKTLDVLYVGLVTEVGGVHQLGELAHEAGRDHEVGRAEHAARTHPVGVLLILCEYYFNAVLYCLYD